MKSNKEIVLEFYEKAFNNWDLSEIDDYMWDDYKQHSPEVADGKAGFLEFFNHFIEMKPHAEVVQCIAENDLVCVFFKCTFGNGSVAKVFDLYRLRDGKLAEHWDSPMAIEDVPGKSGNGHF